MSVNQKILDAIELLAASSVEKAGYDKTIQAQILSCEDATIGKYRCRYQDAVFYAYANNSNMNFSNGSYVYILVPGNDMSKEKTILGTTQKLGINYISQAQGDQAYDIVGNNCITLNDIFYLDTINKNYVYTIYKYNNTNEEILDVIALNQYIKQSSSLIVGATFKTSIPLKKQYRGHYGITYKLRFLDNSSNQQVIRAYTVDEDSMIDNPYKLIHKTRQYQIFNIDGPNFIRVESIEIFCQDFPDAVGQITEERLFSGDIQISNLELFGANRMSENQISGVAISFYTPQGTFFINSATENDYKTIVAQVKIKGKQVSAAQRIPFYWGSESVNINSRSEYYNKYLGCGWKCLNEKNIISPGTQTTDPIIEWIPGSDTYIFKFSAATAKNNKLKVAAVYDGNVIVKEINIQNLGLNVPELTIESDSGTKFYYDTGHPTLTCKINGIEQDGYYYYWGYESSSGFIEQLLETTELNTEYENAVNALNNLQSDISNGIKFINAETRNLNQLEADILAFDSIQRVSGNKIYNVQINNITSFGIFKCSVYNNQNIYLGTTSIVLTNSLDNKNLYSLIINNGSAVFQYNENGVAPNSKSLDTQQQIQELSFTIYNSEGQAIDSEIVVNSQDCKIRWQFPIKDSMLIDQTENLPDAGTNINQTYKYYDNKINLIYGIAQKYDIKKQRNQIKLTVNYKGVSLTAETDFMFTKQGQPGTNGTQYLVKLIPNTKMENPPFYPMITKAGNNYYLNYGVNSTINQQQININSGYPFFKAQLWHSGELIWQGRSTNFIALDGVSKPSMVYWQVLRNKYNSNTFDASAFEVTNSDSGNISYLGDHLESTFTTPLANIIKCSITWQGKTYYGTIPIITAWAIGANFRVSLKDYTGFKYAIYTSDGVSPQYDNSHPFEFLCRERINNVWEDISNIEGEHAIEYEVNSLGNYLSTKDGSSTNNNLLEILRNDIYRKDCLKNQWMARPASRYDGACVNVTICCIYKQSGITVGKIHVPIHYLLNKYGLANINEWDGNSIQIDDEGGFILSPQIGSGHKEDDNSFTGLLMGEVRNAGKSKADIGLLGYAYGSRTIFLNSQNGSALFGKANQAQIAIDPTTDRALIYSGNFWKDSFYNPETGLPNYGNYDSDEFYKNYRSRDFAPNNNTNKEGLIIDLTTPEIFFGTGNFYVTKEGYLHAAAGGNIGGWKIDAHSLYSNININEGRITLDAGTYNEETGEVTGPGKIYSHNHDNLTSSTEGFYLSYDGISFGNKAKITSEGVAYFGLGAVDGSNDKHWIINGNRDESYIAYNTDTWTQANDEPNVSKIYLGTNGLSLGNKFSVTPRGRIEAYQGAIGSWEIAEERLQSISQSNGRLYKTYLSAPLYASKWVFSTQSYDPTSNVWRGATYIRADGKAYFSNEVQFHGTENHYGKQTHKGVIDISKINFVSPTTITINGFGLGPDKTLKWAYFRDKNGKYFGTPAVLMDEQASLAKVGDIVNYSGTVNTHLPVGSSGQGWANIATITLSPGTWIVTYGCTFIGAGVVTCALVGPSKYVDSGTERVSLEGSNNSVWYALKGTSFIKIPENVTFTLQGWSSIERNVTRPNLQAVKVGWE